MSKMRKIALIGIAAAFTGAVIAKLCGFPPVLIGAHALPFFMLLIIDSSRRRENPKK